MAERGERNVWTYPQDLNFTFYLGHADSGVDIAASNELYSHFLSPLAVKAKFDFTKLTLAESLQEQVRAKLWYG